MPDPNLFDNNEFIECVRAGCEQKVENDPKKWAEANGNGWWYSCYSGFFYCPSHVPTWVIELLKRRAEDGQTGSI